MEHRHLARSGPSSLEEICQLRTALSEATHAREEQERKIRDLSVRGILPQSYISQTSVRIVFQDEISELRAKLSTAQARASSDLQADIAEVGRQYLHMCKHIRFLLLK